MSWYNWGFACRECDRVPTSARIYVFWTTVTSVACQHQQSIAQASVAACASPHLPLLLLLPAQCVGVLLTS
jgi:hypothetical protein